jgi:hypothetical protein
LRDLFIARVKINLANIRGYYSGDVGGTTKQLTLDYRMLLEQGEKLREQTREFILESLNRLSLVQLTRDRAEIAENVNKERGYQPPMFPIMTA